MARSRLLAMERARSDIFPILCFCPVHRQIPDCDVANFYICGFVFSMVVKHVNRDALPDVIVNHVLPNHVPDVGVGRSCMRFDLRACLSVVEDQVAESDILQMII